MSWAVGYDSRHRRFIGYGVPAYCDHPGCHEEIDRGLSYVCGSDAYGGDHGCGLHFCSKHRHIAGERRSHVSLCWCCYQGRGKEFAPTPEHPDWMRHVLRDASWREWRKENPEAVAAFRKRLRAATATTDTVTVTESGGSCPPAMLSS